MTYQLTLQITEDSPQAHNIDAVAEARHITREEAALRMLAEPPKPSKASPEALAIIGAFRDDAELMDEVMELIMSERERSKSEVPRV